jgi:hypothetical protein
LDGRRKGKRFLLKPIDKVPQGGMSNYPGCNKRERRGSLGKHTKGSDKHTKGSDRNIQRAQRRVTHSNGWKSRRGKKPEPRSLDGRRKGKRFLLKPIDKVLQGRMSNYPGRNLRERRSSLVRDKHHWPSLLYVGEGSIFLLTLAER